MISRTCRFDTERLLVREWHSPASDGAAEQDLAKVVGGLLTPAVTQSLPQGWQGDYDAERAANWIEERDRQGATLLVLARGSRAAVGLMILFEDDDEPGGPTVRLGYFLSELAWGQGLATELVRGFTRWCRSVDIALIVAGVERANVASQRVLEKNGFVRQHASSSPSELLFELRL